MQGADPMGYTGRMKKERDPWLKDMWKIKANKWRRVARLHAQSGIALLRALIFPGLELRRLEGRLAGWQRSREDEVLGYAGKWFATLDRLGLRPTCLVRSLALARVLREEGHDARLVFGVRSGNGDMEGHCWVAIGERPITEAPSSYEELLND
jgi:Transglutaminase-like superfamily